MPIINDATVINQAYDTSGNGGRKLVRLDNGWLISLAINNTNSTANIYTSKDNGASWVLSLSVPGLKLNSAKMSTLSSKGDFAYFVYAPNGTNALQYRPIKVNATNDNIEFFNTWTTFDDGQSEYDSISLAINEAKTELHAAWSSKNSTYPSSFNIRYAKGTINTDGSVIWGAVEQVTNFNLTSGTNMHYINPSIITCNGNPLVFFHQNHGVGNGYDQIKVNYKTNGVWKLGAAVNDHVGMGYTVYNGGTYVQGAPSAIFVPKSINGLANGRIWVAWHGRDSLYPNDDNIRISYSDNGGVTWSGIQYVTNYNLTTPYNHSQFVSLTANINNEIFAVYRNGGTTPGFDLAYSKYNGESWSQEILKDADVTNGTDPSAIFDVNLNYAVPLTIYRDKTKVGFYGTWTVTNISAPQGSIGAVTDKNNLLTYSITTDGEMGEIVEKVNGVVVGTKTAVSGESLTVGLTQEQWDAVKFGKYAYKNSLDMKDSSFWEQGSINNVTGTVYTPVSSTTRIRFKNSIKVSPNNFYQVTLSTNHRFYVIEYDNNGLQTKTATYLLNGESFIADKNTSHIRAFMQRIDNTAIDTTESVVLNLKIIPPPTDNALSIEMGSEKWTYTFDKQLALDADMLSTVKALKDSQDIHLPAVKYSLASSVRAKGVNVGVHPSFEDIGNAIDGIELGKKRKSGTLTMVNETINGSTHQVYNVPALGFTPSRIIIYNSSAVGSRADVFCLEYNPDMLSSNAVLLMGTASYSVIKLYADSTGAKFHHNDGVPLRQLKWEAFE